MLINGVIIRNTYLKYSITFMMSYCIVTFIKLVIYIYCIYYSYVPLFADKNETIGKDMEFFFIYCLQS